jgi:hypothetical protein
MSDTVLTGNAHDIGSTTKLIKMGVTDCDQLTQVQVGANGAPFSGTYTPKTAKLLVSQDQFNDIGSKIAGGAVIPISVTINANVVKQFCYTTICISASIVPAAGIAAARVDTAIPNSGVKNKDGESTDDTSATGTE